MRLFSQTRLGVPHVCRCRHREIYFLLLNAASGDPQDHILLLPVNITGS